MAESQPSTHSDLMDLRAKGKKLHRRTQSHTTFSLNDVVNKKNNSEEFFQEMLQNHNILNGDVTQKVLDAANREENEKEVIVDDIDEIPNTGIIIPQGLAGANNPLNSIQKRGLVARNSFQNTGSQFKKIDMISQVRNIDDLTGLGTIHEKRNSMESVDTENMNKRSPNMTNSGSSSQNISKVVSRTHSKHPSLDFKIGNSCNSSIDFRPAHSKQSSVDMWSLHSKQSSIDFRPTHSKQSSADFRTMNKDLTHGIRVEKEIDIIKYNLLSPKTIKVSDSIQADANIDYFDKRNRFVNELQKSSVDKVKRGNSGADHASSKIAPNKHEETKPKLKVSNTLESKDKTSKVEKPQTNSKHRRTYSGNNSKGSEITSPKEDLALSGVFLNAKNPREPADKVMSPHREKATEQHIERKEINRIITHNDPMKKLTTKTDLLEGQIKNIFNIIDSFASEKTQLEEKIHLQDRKIKELMELTNKYQEEIKNLKGKNEHKTVQESNKVQDNNKKIGTNKAESSGLNVLTTTDGSAFDSSLTESSGFLSNKDSRTKIKPVSKFPLTPHGQTKVQIPKGEDRKSPGPAMSNKIDQNTGLTKKISLGFKKPTLKKN